MPDPLSRLQLARDEINKTFGVGFAEKHPEVQHNETDGERLCGYTGPTGFYRLKRAKYLVCNMYDATLKMIAAAKV